MSKTRRNTRQREIILEELRKLRSHPVASDLHKIVRKRIPHISLGTVYRNLDLLVQMELIQKLEINGRETRFDGNPVLHYHVRCVYCERVDDVQDYFSEPAVADISRINGFDIICHRLDFIGICPECQKKAGMSRHEVMN